MNRSFWKLTRLVPIAAALALSAVTPGISAAQEQQMDAAGITELKDVQLDAAERQRFVGEYTLTTPDGQTLPFRVWEENGILMGQPGDSEPSRLFYQGENVFRPEKQPAFAMTFVVEGDRAVRFTATRDDREGVLRGVRIP